MKLIYMECTLALIAGINPSIVEELSRQGRLGKTETMRYLVVEEDKLES